MARLGWSVPLVIVAALVVLAALLGRTALADSQQTCVDVRIGDQRSYTCLNEALARAALAAHGVVNPGLLSATSEPQAIGAFDRTATAERMGNTFGHSAFAQRPPRPVYLSPLLTPSAR